MDFTDCTVKRFTSTRNAVDLG